MNRTAYYNARRMIRTLRRENRLRHERGLRVEVFVPSLEEELIAQMPRPVRPAMRRRSPEPIIGIRSAARIDRIARDRSKEVALRCAIRQMDAFERQAVRP